MNTENLPPPKQQQSSLPLKDFVFTAEEQIVMRQCRIESIVYRGLPLAAVFGGLTRIAMKKGVLNSNRQFTYMTFAAFAGITLGEFSYANVFKERLLRIPNGTYAKHYRKEKELQDSLDVQPGFSVASPSTDSAAPLEPIFDDHRPELQNITEGLDDYERNVTDYLNPYTDTQSSSHSSYDDIRRQNREEHYQKMSEKYRRSFSDENSISNLPADSTKVAQPKSRYVKVNQYGDEVY